MFKQNKQVLTSFIISFIYIFTGTYDNLSGLNIEKYLKNLICNGDRFCDLFMLIFYSQSYLYGALICGFFGSSDLAFIFCQIFVWIFFFAFTYLIILLSMLLLKKLKNKICKQ